ncbi:MAG: PepSY-associated TM helix domain-containing protein [Bacteroidota bacterium]
MTVKKLIGKIHLWLGLASGLVVFILGITGCVWVFEEEIKSVVYKDRMFSDQQTSAQLPLAQLYENARNSLPTDMSIDRVMVYNNPKRTVMFRGSQPQENNEGIWYWNNRDFVFDAYFDPYTGKLKKLENRTFEFFMVVAALHMTLLLDYEIGTTIVGISVLIFVITLITGLMLWWPKNKSAAKQRVWFRWKPTTKWKRKNYDLHNIAGFYMMFFALILALTGLMWSFQWFSDGVKWIANGGKTIEVKQEKVASDTAHTSAQYPIDKVLRTLRQDFSEADMYFFVFPKKPSDPYTVFTFFEHNYDHIYSYFDQYTGKQLNQIKFTDRDNGNKLKKMNFDIHTGKILGLPGKILAFFASLVSASLPVTGFLIWWGRRNKKRIMSTADTARKRKRPVKAGVHLNGKQPSHPKAAHVRPCIPSSSK